MRYKWKRIIAGSLSVLMLCSGIGGDLSVYGAEAAVDVDETMYVNLDFYGAATKVNVVKSCNFNGRTEFIDYGNYLDVKNMTNDAVPVLEEGLVKWTMPEDQRGRFYYQCTMDMDQVELPWKFDVSYKLNGVPTDADKLAGASGLVEINIKAKPNDKAKPYYQNNMLLMAAIPVDMSKCYSVEADGSQTQNLGAMTTVIFSALPGEEGDFTVRIGTDSFETTGVILSMVPGTIEDLEHIKDLKESKDTWKEAGDQLYDSMEQMALSVEGMREGVNQVQAGMDSAERARQKWSAGKDSILAGNDQALAALTAMSNQMGAMVPYLQTAKDAADVVHESMNNIVNTLGDMQEPLQKLYNRLMNIKSSSEDISKTLPELQSAMEQLILLDFKLRQNEDQFMMNLKSARNSSLRANSLYYADEMEDEDANEDEEVYWSDDYLGIEGKAQDTSKGAEETSERETGGVSDEAVKKQEEPAADSVNSREEEKDAQEPAKSENETANESSISSSDSAESNVVPDTSNENASIPSSSQTLGKASLSKEKRETVLLGAGSAADIISGLTGKGKSLAVIAGQSKKLAEAMSSLMADTSDAAKYSSQLVDNLDMLIEDVTALNDSLDVYYPDFQACLDDTKELVTCTTDALNSSVSTLTIVQNTLKDTSNDFDAAARDSLRGSMELLDKSLNVLDSTASMRHAGRTMKDTMDNELDKFDTENRFLFMEPSAEKISFTSEKNRAPKTLQIVLRTDEISLDDDTAKTADAEAAKAQVSPLRRMWNVLVKLWRAMVSIFKNR
ncbi:MAG: methyl-accepting chemotaxis protein [Clostridiaceae bacterium]|uniref:Methyl-accepting chemotaxis protein n=1 Tax=Clostridium porci TaxID=2605778 RepID=A0A7X2TC03_9CLOT|nr:methyl-accepting chemotaxis protein [Clostridium porci]MDY3231772.1 methyl-accepting chemotaxis protein [Clostridiaceae bacterium]MSS36367.1 methyl-accepting chemotaxis protein [Clostridium porci]